MNVKSISNTIARRATTGTILLMTIVSLTVMTHCTKKSDPVPETERVKQLLIANTWNLQTVTVDLTDQTPVYSGLTLSFTDINYTATHGGLVWPASGTWTFADNTAKNITRNDGLAITIEEVSSTKLVLKFTWLTGTISGGKSFSVAGVHQFTFTK